MKRKKSRPTILEQAIAAVHKFETGAVAVLSEM